MKTVFLLGAGFSVEAGAPVQAKLMEHAFRLHFDNPSNFNTKHFTEFQNFLSDQLNIIESNFSEVELEDIFTPIDRCLSENSQFRGIGVDRMLRVREAVFYVVGRTIQLVLNESSESSKGYITNFAKYIASLSSVRKQHNYNTPDPVSVISTNWDILLDNSIYHVINDSGHDAVVDYCCYISSKDEQDESIKPGLEKLGLGGFNVKLLKLHGSLNWLQCPRCMRLYAQFSKKIAINNFEPPSSCRHCDTNFPEEADNHKLVSNLIMPTFIKDLSNPQYKIIWQNAGIEISEAAKIVFIGYSLPSADFEMRQLLSRMTRKSAKIEVVDYCSIESDKHSIKKHWSRFFGDRELTFNFNGTKSYVENLIETNKN